MNVSHSRFAEAVKAAAAAPDEEQAFVAATAILEGSEALAVFGLDAPKPEAGTENAGGGGACDSGGCGHSWGRRRGRRRGDGAGHQRWRCVDRLRWGAVGVAAGPVIVG